MTNIHCKLCIYLLVFGKHGSQLREAARRKDLYEGFFVGAPFLCTSLRREIDKLKKTRPTFFCVYREKKRSRLDIILFMILQYMLVDNCRSTSTLLPVHFVRCITKWNDDDHKLSCRFCRTTLNKRLHFFLTSSKDSASLWAKSSFTAVLSSRWP